MQKENITLIFPNSSRDRDHGGPEGMEPDGVIEVNATPTPLFLQSVANIGPVMSSSISILNCLFPSSALPEQLE